MPLGIQRINAQQKQPNERIVFIKPLEGPDKALAQDFLERIAAICSPIMKANHLAVMSLEEYEPNPEFVGRNFNAGEVIQLVLKARFTGQWLPFRHVQMVMMHELAHIKQMNHSGAFWKIRNQYAEELKSLWTKNYTGDGFWSRGQTLLSGRYTTTTMPDEEMMPRSLCGGTYRSSGKRKRGRTAATTPALTYAQRKERRIAKKFGTSGVSLGANDQNRIKLEKGKRVLAKPRVAQSARGRELRAAAALERFGKQQTETKPSTAEARGRQDEKKPAKVELNEDMLSDEETECELIDEVKGALDINGKEMRDGQGRAMVKVCEDEKDPQEDDNVRQEMEELQQLMGSIVREKKPMKVEAHIEDLT
ncbi:MAG: hypothetical protein M1823_000375 [Watsoniomyces obsoletus]|nr:MAG: hypothetical protein M1823_000375 [Watsoniomyces obsoletus]